MAGIRSTGRFSIDALGYVDDWRDEHGVLIARTRLFRSGVFECGQRWDMRPGYADLPGKGVVKSVHDGLAYLSWVYAQAVYYGRLRIWIRIDNADHARLGTPSAWLAGPEGQETIEYVADVNVEELRTNCMPLTRAATNVLFQGFGLPASPYFTPEGEFAG